MPAPGNRSTVTLRLKAAADAGAPGRPAVVLTPRGTRMLGGIAEAYADANFRRYSIGSIVSWLSFVVQAVAVAWVTWSLTRSPGWLAAIALLDAIPMSILAPIGGVVADRYDRFRVLMIAYGFAALQAALLAALAFAHALTIERLAALTALHGLIHAFSVPAQFGLLPRFVARERLPAAIAVASAYTQLGLFVGPALAGWVLLHGGAALAFASNVAGYGIYFWSASRLEPPPCSGPPPPSGRSFRGDLADGLRMIGRNRGFAALLGLMVFGDALNAAIRQMLPAFADRGLGAGVAGFSTLLTGAGVGAALSALWLAQGGIRRTTSTHVGWAFLGYLAATTAFLAAHGLAAATLAMGARGFCFEICRTGSITLLQTAVPDAARGRLMSVQFLLQQGASAAGVAAIGLLAADSGLRLPLLCGTGIALLAWIVTFRPRAGMAQPFPISRDST